MIAQQSGLSNIQKELLKLYANNISDQALFEIKLMLSQYFAENLTEEMDKFLDEHGISDEELIKWSHEHNRREGGN